jgi:hypothetical protein
MSYSHPPEIDEKKLKILECKIENLTQTVIDLSRKIDRMCGSCENMDEHINFVNGVYKTVRSPLQWVVQQTNTLMGSDTTHSDEIKQLPYK